MTKLESNRTRNNDALVAVTGVIASFSPHLTTKLSKSFRRLSHHCLTGTGLRSSSGASYQPCRFRVSVSCLVVSP